MATERRCAHRDTIFPKLLEAQCRLVPPNLLAIANTESNGRYQVYCKENAIEPHPARYPAALPEYFIRMLTDPNDTVLDPFAGSCVTGDRQSLGRRWICCELDEQYLLGARGRFAGRSDGKRRP